MRYLIGTRGSKLALVQTDYVIDKLKRAYPDDDFKAVIIKTTGDLEQKKALDKIGSKGIFVKEIEDELLSGKIHMAVHSMKDMPDEPAAGLTFAKAWKREDPRDVLVLKNAASLDELPHGAVIGTGSKRRMYQLLKLRFLYAALRLFLSWQKEGLIRFLHLQQASSRWREILIRHFA